MRELIPVTAPMRTLVDLADCSTRRDLERAIDEAQYLGWDLSSLRPFPGRRGAGMLAAVLDEHIAGTTPTRSDFEELLLELCRNYGRRLVRTPDVHCFRARSAPGRHPRGCGLACHPHHLEATAS
jgi:hypothetical protein